jgi:hypothetical protein
MAAAQRTADDTGRMLLPINVPLCDYETVDGQRQLSAVLDEVTLTYCIVERGVGGRTRSLRRHVPLLRKARRWASAYGRERTCRSS